MPRIHVLIAGGGLGGLCLAQGLREGRPQRHGFERDADLNRKTGYRLHMNADGGNALRACLPEDLFELYLETSRTDPPRQLAVVLDDQLNEMSVDAAHRAAQRRPAAAHGRPPRALRQILLGRLGDAVRLGRPPSATRRTRRRPFRLADGCCVDGRRAGRRGRHPLAGPHPATARRRGDRGGHRGSRALRRARRSPRIAPAAGHPASTASLIATNKRGGLLALGAFTPRQPVAQAVAAIAPDVAVDPVEDYLMVSGSVAPGTEIPPPREWTAETAAVLHDSMLAAVEGWHPQLRGVVERIDRDTMFAIPSAVSTRRRRGNPRA